MRFLTAVIVSCAGYAAKITDGVIGINHLAHCHESRYLSPAFECSLRRIFSASAPSDFPRMIFSLSRPLSPHVREKDGACMSESSPC